jgi:energy-coupling factor transporter ATP-binding protein EcfA2
MTITAPEPLLRTLAPALRQLERSLRAWLDGGRRQPLSVLARATLEGLANDLGRQGAALDVDRPLLVILLMGGTGVGKSTLLNALAGGPIAEASYVRPTTRDAVVYYHHSVRPDRLDPALQHCRLAMHERPALEQKILVDTPDLDSNDLANREQLQRLLPAADIVLYVGSQEKYHDRLGWDLLLEQRRRRAFAFVLNKWDRCLHGDGGVRPDQDLLRDLRGEGFEDPVLFRTCAQCWSDRGPADSPNGAALPEGEQFEELVRWLETGLTRLEIEAIKARGVSQLLQQLEQALASACPPDLDEAADSTRSAWESTLGEEAAATVEILLNTLNPYQRDIEQHFALEGQRRFRGMMAGYLNIIHRLKYLGSTLRDRFSLLPGREKVPATAAWDLAAFSRSASALAGDQHLNTRARALVNRLLVQADQQGFPVNLLSEPAEAAAHQNWRQRYAQLLTEVLQQVERHWVEPAGMRRWLQAGLVLVADWLPLLALLAALVMLLWRYFDPMGRGYQVELADIFLPLVVLLTTLIVLHILLVFLLPLRWPVIRADFRSRLEPRIRDALMSTYAAIPGDLAQALHEERGRVQQLLKETRDVSGWLREREQAASVAALYSEKQPAPAGR